MKLRMVEWVAATAALLILIAFIQPQLLAVDLHKALALRYYNGGGYIYKEAKAVGAWDYVKMEQVCTKFRSSASCRENTEYPRRILDRNAPMYATWGRGSCLT